MRLCVHCLCVWVCVRVCVCVCVCVCVRACQSTHSTTLSHPFPFVLKRRPDQPIVHCHRLAERLVNLEVRTLTALHAPGAAKTRQPSNKAATDSIAVAALRPGTPSKGSSSCTRRCEGSSSANPPHYNTTRGGKRSSGAGASPWRGTLSSSLL